MTRLINNISLWRNLWVTVWIQFLGMGIGTMGSSVGFIRLWAFQQKQFFGVVLLSFLYYCMLMNWLFVLPRWLVIINEVISHKVLNTFLMFYTKCIKLRTNLEKSVQWVSKSQQTRYCWLQFLGAQNYFEVKNKSFKFKVKSIW